MKWGNKYCFQFCPDIAFFFKSSFDFRHIYNCWYSHSPIIWQPRQTSSKIINAVFRGSADYLNDKVSSRNEVSKLSLKITINLVKSIELLNKSYFRVYADRSWMSVHPMPWSNVQWPQPICPKTDLSISLLSIRTLVQWKTIVQD